MAIGDAYKGLIEAVKEQGNVDDNPILTNILDTVKMTGQSLMALYGKRLITLKLLM